MKQQNIVRSLLERYFISPCSCPPFLEIAFTAFQLFVFTVLISSSTNKTQEMSQSNILLVFIALVCFTLLRLATRISLIKVFYVIFIYWLSERPTDSASILCFILIVVNLVSDWLSKVEYSFSTLNPHSSKNAYFIGFHYLGIILCTILKVLDLNIQIIFPISSITIFSVLLVAKYKSLVKNERFKQLYMRFYLLSIFYSILTLVEVWVELDSVYKHLISIIISQALYEVVKFKNKQKFSIQEYISKGLIEEVSFKLFSYLYSKTYDSHMEKIILAYIHDDGNSLLTTQRNQSKNSFFKKQSTMLSQDRKLLSVRIYQILKEQKSFYPKILRSQIALCQLNDYFNCKLIINKYKQKMQFFSFFQKVLMYKLQCTFNQKICISTENRMCPNFQDFIENDIFRSMLLKSTLQCIILWEYTKVSEIIYSKLSKIVTKVIKAEQTIAQKYKKLKVKQIKASIFYAQFLFKVMRDTKKANELLQQVYFYQQSQVDLSFQDKVYISFDLQADQPLTISNIGNNISKLLGFQRRLLIGSKHSIFMPNFYHQPHLKIVNSKLILQFDNMFLYYKKTIVKNMSNTYQQVLMVLKVSFDSQFRLILHGYFKIMSSQKYNWNNYLFVKTSNLQILECSQQIRQKISNGKAKKYNAEDFFDSVQAHNLKTMQIVSQQAVKYYYQPIRQFNCQQSNVLMFVRIDPFHQTYRQQNSSQLQVDRVKTDKLLIPSLNLFFKHQMNSQYKQVLLEKQIIKSKINKNNTKLLIFCSAVLLAILVLIVCQGLFYNEIQTSLESKNEMVAVMNKLVTHYMSLSKIALDLSYLQLQFNYNYTWPGYEYSLQRDVINIQDTNQYFKKYSVQQWPYQSLSSVQEHRNGYEFIAEITACANVIVNIQDRTIQKNMIAAFNELFTEIFVWTYSQYSNAVIKQLDNHLDSRKLTKVLILAFLFVTCLAVLILVILIQTIIRKSQYQSLQFIGGVSFQNQLIQDCKSFAQKISCERVDAMCQNLQLGQKKDGFDSLLKSGDLSSRQNTGRNLMDALSSMRQNDLQQKTSQQVFKKKVNIKLKDRNKLILSIVFVLLFTIIVLHLVNAIVNSYIKVLDEAQSAAGVILLMNKPLYFTRVVNAFMTQDKIGVTDHDKTFYRSVKAFQADSNNIANFKQTQFQQFQQFSKLLTQIRYQYLCNYVTCPPKYYDYINILYATSMQKQVDLMISDPSVSFFQSNSMQTILASEGLFRQVMIQLLELYFDEYQMYAEGIADSQAIVFNIAITILALLCAYFALMGYFFVWKQNMKFEATYNLVKNESYLYKEQDLKFQEPDQRKLKQNAASILQNNGLNPDQNKSKINSKISNSSSGDQFNKLNSVK